MEPSKEHAHQELKDWALDGEETLDVLQQYLVL